VKINIHRYENEKWGRAHLPFFKEFDKYLSLFFDVNIINYNKDGNTFKGEITLKGSFNQFGNNPIISDVENVIENEKTGEIVVLSCTEYFNHFVVHLSKSESCKKILLSHFNYNNIYYWMKRDNNVKNMGLVSPWIFLPFENFNPNNFINNEKINNKLFFKGSGLDSYRKTVNELKRYDILQSTESVSHLEYLNQLSKSKLALSFYQDLDKYNTPFDYPGEYCYRDIEYIMLGVPFIRIEYKDSLYNDLIPNKHYISIPRELAYVTYKRNGDKGVARLIHDKYIEIKDDNEFLSYISKNQLLWYNENLEKSNKLKLTYNLLGINEWLK